MSERNKLTASPVEGTNALLINGFQISIIAYQGCVIYKVLRKDALVYSADNLQDAVKWCED